MCVDKFQKLMRDHRIGRALLAAILGALLGLVSVAFHYGIEGWSYLMTGYADYTQHLGPTTVSSGGANGSSFLFPQFRGSSMVPSSTNSPPLHVATAFRK